MIWPIDPTGRSDRQNNRKLLRLLALLGGVFVVGAGIGWIVGQIGGPAATPITQNVATTLPKSLPTAPDTLAQSQPVPVPPTEIQPQPAAASVTDQHSAANFIAQATQQPVPPTSGPVPPGPGTPIASATPAPETKPPPVVVIEPQQDLSSEPVTTKPTATPAPSQPAHPARHHPAREKPVKHRSTTRHRPKPALVGSESRVTVIGARGAPSGTRWTIQLGAFKTHDHAALLVMTLQSHGTAASVTKRDEGAKGTWYVVQTPSLASLKTARSTAEGIAARERLSAYVMRAE